jgi:S1-C subfamily serine protease
VAVLSVREDSAAFVANIRAGHIITEVFGTPVKNTDELLAELANHDLTKLLRIRVHDGQFDRAVFLELPANKDTTVEP